MTIRHSLSSCKQLRQLIGELLDINVYRPSEGRDTPQGPRGSLQAALVTVVCLAVQRISIGDDPPL